MAKISFGGLIGGAPNNLFSSSGSSGIWSLDGVYAQRLSAEIRSTEVVSGLTQWYVASDFDSINQTWEPYNEYGSTLSTGRGAIGTSLTTGNGATGSFDIISGSGSDGITIGALPSTFTLFHVTRYISGGGRIFDGLGNNWLSGVWGGNTGVFYHDGWMTSTTDVHGSNWFIATDQNSLCRTNGVQRGTGGGGTSTTLTINNGNYKNSETSSFQVAEIMIYNRALSSSEYQQVESELSDWYGIPA